MVKRLYKKIRTLICILLAKIQYGNKVEFGKRIGLLKGFNVVVEQRGKLIIGNDVFFNNYCSVNCLSSITIGNGCIFGEGVKLYDHNHEYKDKDVPIKQQGFKKGKISIGENCWIGSNVIILNNVNIGDNVVIGANCLIYKSIPSNSIVKNNSGRLISNKY
ncbi:MAG TPA: acyltransferase [Clostridium sp.]|nr:acyltransferase [Clostridium sp.]